MVVRGSPTQVIYKRFNRKKWLDPLLDPVPAVASMAVVASRPASR